MILEFGDLSLHYDIRIVDGTVPALFLHSALASESELEDLRARFPERTTITLDLPGHGESITTREAINTTWIGEILEQALDRLHVPIVDVIGYSLGGYVGLELAVHRLRKSVAS